MSGYLTTHVLDTATGLPAAGMGITLFKLVGAARIELATAVTNEDGRTDAPMLAGEDFEIGTYELLFNVGPYLDATQGPKDGPRFLDVVPLRFGIDDVTAHYHVPLLVSPFSYSTYRGS